MVVAVAFAHVCRYRRVNRLLLRVLYRLELPNFGPPPTHTEEIAEASAGLPATHTEEIAEASAGILVTPDPRGLVEANAGVGRILGERGGMRQYSILARFSTMVS
jgi:hypothetical protein